MNKEKAYFDVRPDTETDEQSPHHSTSGESLSVEIQRNRITFNNQVATLLILRNISTIINCEKQKNENKYLEILTATISHELMTPLNAVINLTSYLKRKFETAL